MKQNTTNVDELDKMIYDLFSSSKPLTSEELEIFGNKNRMIIESDDFKKAVEQDQKSHNHTRV